MLLHNPTAGAAHPSLEELLETIHRTTGIEPKHFSTKNSGWKGRAIKALGPSDLSWWRWHCRKERALAKRPHHSDRNPTCRYSQQHCSLTRH